MKRKLILLPTLTVLSSMPLTSMVACKSTTQTELIFLDKDNFQFFDSSDTVKLTPYVYPYDSTNEFVWESSDPENFPVTQDGLVSWSGEGYYANIYVHPKGNEYVLATCRVNACFDFENCDWPTFIYHCNELEQGGIDNGQFCHSFYFVDEHTGNKEIPQSIDEFIGHKKKLNVNRAPHEVIILGVRQDHQEYEGVWEGKDLFTAPVAFTFQFNNVICATDKQPILFQWNSNKTSANYWEEGQIHDKLNNVDDGVLSMIDDPIVRNNIKTVKRRVNVQKLPNAPWEPVMGDEKIFMPTVFDIFDSTLEPSKPPYWKNYWNEGVIYDYEITEGGLDWFISPYLYYKNNINLGQGRIGKQDCLIRKDLWNNPCEYWLASPYGIEAESLGSDYTDLINVVFKDGHSRYLDSSLEKDVLHSDHKYPIAPCFCI